MPVSNVHLPMLTADDVLASLRTLRARQPVKFSAFYSSQLGGVVTDPALMVIPFDDHMVHRGHGIFDTAGLVNGRIYDLEAHLDRFLGSAERSRLELAGLARRHARHHRQDNGGQRRARRRDRYWLSSGPGSLELSPAAGAEPGFFVMIFAGLSYPDRWYTEGLRVMTTTYPIKPPLYAITKATNYLPNVLMQMEAKEAGLDNGVFIDDDGIRRRELEHERCVRDRRRRASTPEVRARPARLHVACGCSSSHDGLVGRGAVAGVEVCDIPVARGARRARDDAARQLGEGGADCRMGRSADWRRKARARCRGRSSISSSRTCAPAIA